MSDYCEYKIDVIDSAQLHQLLEQNPPPFLLDVRQPEEYQQEHIPGSVLIPLSQLEYKYSSLPIEQPIIIYCRSGARSMVGANILCRVGFKQLTNLGPGMLGWNYETIKGKPQQPLTSTQVESVIDVLLVVLKNEIFGQIFYGNELQSANEEEVREVLSYLTRLEELHVEKIYAEYKRLALEYNIEVQALEDIEREAAPLDPSWREDTFATTDTLTLLEQAIQWEYKSYDFYKISAENIEQDVIRSMLYDLAFEERAHASALLNLLGRMAVR